MEAAYEEIRAKHDLPPFKKTDSEFDISGIEPKGNLLKEVLQHLHRKVERTAQLVQDIVNPSGDTVVDLIESSFFTQEDRAKLASVEKEIMVAYRKILVAQYENNDAAIAKAISQIVEQWPTIRKSLLPYLRKLPTGWQERTVTKEILEYMG